MKIVFLDSVIVNQDDISWEELQELGQLTVYKRSSREEAIERMKDVEAVFLDSVGIDRQMLEQCPDLKFIGLASTGYNHVDLEAAKDRGIAVCNVPSYAADAVAQQQPSGSM